MPAQTKKDQPNILLLMTDQQRFDSLGCCGADWLATPNLDRLAGEGVVFENCCVNNTVCTPSRASMFTGKHLPGHGVYRLHDVLPDDEVCFTERLQLTGELADWMLVQEKRHGARGGEAVPSSKQRIVNTLK